jgi:hypothetical protein
VPTRVKTPEHQSCSWTDDTFDLWRRTKSRQVLYKYTIKCGLVPFSIHGETGRREDFVMIAVPSNEFSCPSEDELLAYMLEDG